MLIVVDRGCLSHTLSCSRLAAEALTKFAEAERNVAANVTQFVRSSLALFVEVWC